MREVDEPVPPPAPGTRPCFASVVGCAISPLRTSIERHWVQDPVGPDWVEGASTVSCPCRWTEQPTGDDVCSLGRDRTPGVRRHSAPPQDDASAKRPREQEAAPGEGGLRS